MNPENTQFPDNNPPQPLNQSDVFTPNTSLVELQVTTPSIDPSTTTNTAPLVGPSVAPTSFAPQAEQPQTPESQYSPQKPHSTGGGFKKTILTMLRSTVAHVIAIFMIGVIGWLTYQWTGVFGVHYKEAGQPLLDASDSYHAISFDMVDVRVGAQPFSTGETGAKVDRSYKDAVKHISEFKTSLKDLEQYKAFKSNTLAKDYDAFKKSSAKYIDYTSSRTESYKLATGAIYDCGYISYLDDNAVASFTKCKTILGKIDQTQLHDTVYKDYLTAYKKYIDATLTTFSGIPSGGSKYKYFTEFTGASEALHTSVTGLREKETESEDRYSPQETIMALEKNLTKHIEDEKESGH